jgi:hypothetical protein
MVAVKNGIWRVDPFIVYPSLGCRFVGGSEIGTRTRDVDLWGFTLEKEELIVKNQSSRADPKGLPHVLG